MTGGSDVALLIPVTFENSIADRHEKVRSDIKLSVVVQKWLAEVRLHYKCPFVLVFRCVRLSTATNDPSDLVDAAAATYTVTSISKFSGFDDPDIWTAVPSSFVEVVLEALELFILRAILNVEG